MAEEIRVSKTGASPRMDNGQVMYQERRGSMMPWMILGVLIVVLGVLGFLFRDKLFATNKSTDKAVVTAKASGYQAVFLSNGQVYFGKIESPSSDYVTLKDIYYLQVTQPPLQGSQQQGQQSQTQAQPQLSLVKLGNELHGPVDEMKINRDQILFYEDMKEDAKVMQAINEYKANPTQGQTQTPTTPSTTTPKK